MLARWQEFVGTGELLRSLETRVGRLRDRVVNAVKGKPQQAERVTVAVESGLETLLLEHAEAAAERAEASWQRLAPGQALLADARRGPRPRLARLPPPRRAGGARLAAGRARAWCAPRAPTSGPPPGSSRSASTGSRVALMVVVFAHTGGSSAPRPASPAARAVLGQKLLEAVFGDQAVRSLAERARQDLEDRIRDSARRRARRYTDLLDVRRRWPGAAERLRAAARRVDDLRFAAAAHARLRALDDDPR